MILESKGTPNLVNDIIDNNLNDIKNCIENNLSFKLVINESTDNYNLVADVKINFNFGDRYYANMNYKESLDSNFKNCIINVNYPKIFEMSLIFKSLSHELTHLYELYQIKDKFDKTRWKWQDALNNTIKQQKLGSDITYFRDMLYLSLPQELNARVSSIYIYLSMKSNPNTSKYELIKMLEETNSYLLKIDKMFKKSAKKYKNKLIRVVDRIYEEKNKKIEYLTYDPGDVNYEKYIKDDKQKSRNEKIEILLEYTDFIKEINKQNFNHPNYP
jgi:hypothetical protein